MLSTDFLAVYAAIVATCAVSWDVYKWWRTESVRLIGSTSTNIKVLGDTDISATDGKTYIILRVQNRGSAPCIVQSVVLKQHKTLIGRLRGVPDFNALVNHTLNFGPALPKKLSKGDEFSSGVEQVQELERLSREGHLYMGVSHTMAEKPFWVRVKPIKSGP